MTWYLRSLADRETHWAEPLDDGTVVAACGVRFAPPRRFTDREPQLIGPPPDPEQICPTCAKAAGEQS